MNDFHGKKLIIYAIPSYTYKLGFGCEFRGFHGSVIENSVFLGCATTTSWNSWFPNISKQH